MNLISSPRSLLRATFLLASLALSALSLHAAAASGGLAGSVTSTATRNALQGAIVSIPALNRSELTDNAGSFLFRDLPAGSVEVVVTYSGFDERRIPATVRAGETVRIDAEMKPSQAIMMDAFTVATQREGQALSITEQRNAVNVKNVTAFDEWGILPTQNVGELVTRLPGITFTTDEDQLINNVSIRGQPASYTRLNIDGMSSTGVGGDGRTATLHSFSGGMYEQVEIIAGQTPDKRADSLGGQLNLKTRSPLAMSEPRRITYTASGRYFPSWSRRNFAVAERPLRPDFNVSYTEVFDIRGERRKLGVAITASYQEILNGHDWDLLQYENTTNPIAQLRNYNRQSGLNDRFISAISARADYQLSSSTRISLRFLYNAGSEPFFHYTAMNPLLNSSLTVNSPTNPNGAIKPGYTTSRIEFLPVANTTLQPGGVPIGAAYMRIFPQRYSFTSKNPTGTLVFEHDWGRLKLDHAYRWSNTHWDSGAGRQRQNGTLDVRTKDPMGFVLDYSNPEGKVFSWTGGANPYLASSYTPYVVTAANATTQPVPATSAVFNKRDFVTDTNEVSATVNATYNLSVAGIPVVAKAGLDTVNRRVNGRNVYPRRWYQVPGTTLPTSGLMPLTEFERLNGGQRMPVFDPAAISTTLNNSALWTEDVNFTATQQYSGRYIMEEGVDAAYVQAQGKFGRLILLGGVRGEWVNTEVFTYFRARTTPIATEPDHFKRAAMDFSRQSRDGSYHKFFPGIHASYDITSNIKARASWTTSYGRPRRQDIVPTPSFSDTNRTVTLGNASLKPQLAKNIDVKLEYYYSSTGMFSVSGYRKTITDYIGSATRSGLLVPDGPDNGFDGLYSGYEIIQASNLGNAKLLGFEADFRQRLSFLPGLLKGLTVRGNYTYLETEGRFAGSVELKNGQVAGFVPRAYNAGLMYTYRNFGASFDVNYTGRYPVGYSLTSPGSGNIYRQTLTVMNVGVSYKIRPNATLFLNVNNIAQQGAEQYTFEESRTRSHWVVPRTLKFGIDGRF